MRSLYIHFPFCETKCHYCDFYSLGRERTKEGDADRFEKALTLESAREAHRLGDRLDSIFFGGGTPSMTPPESMARALAPLDLGRRVTTETEWTMEANPSSVTLESLRAYRAFGVNRISMGVQAMRDDLLARLGRVHSREAALTALENIFAAGFTNVSVDLLCGVPGQSLGDIDAAIDALTAFPITHLSCYLLTLHKQHKMFADLPDEDTQLAHLLHLDATMRARGFEHYEISNYARTGHRARHNLNYWTGSSYLALGPSAHSYCEEKGERWKNISSIHRYAQELDAGRSPVEWTETLTPDQRELEKWMLALRLEEGIPEEWLRTTPLREARARTLDEEGLLEAHPSLTGRRRLTARGFALSDQVIAALA